MTNNEIVIWVYKNIDINKFIMKVIDRTKREHSTEDLSQYIYLTLLRYNNLKLNRLYEQKVLPQFIMGIILNQRNYYKSYYNNYLRNNDYEKDEFEEPIDEEYDYEKDEKIEFINKELLKYKNNKTKLSKEEEDEKIRLQFYYIYLKRDITLKELSKRMNMNYRTVLRIAKSAREIIKDNYKKNKPI